MTNFVKPIAATLLLSALASNASALEVYLKSNAIIAPPAHSTYAHLPAKTEALAPTQAQFPHLRRQSPIGFARLDQGRLISTPFRELSDWQALTAITGRAFHPINVGTYLNNVPEMSLPSTDTDNKIDEIRLTARDQGLDYIVIYGFGADANWASIGGKPLKETGLTVPAGTPAWQRGEGKALLVNTYSGDVLGSVITGFEDVEPGAAILAGRVSTLLDTLSVI